MTTETFKNYGDLTYDLASQIVRMIEAADWAGLEVMVSKKVSGQSCSTYVDVAFDSDDSDADLPEPFLIRVSDHEARSYNRTGDFNINIESVDGDTHELLKVATINDEDGDYDHLEVERAELDRVADAALAALVKHCG